MELLRLVLLLLGRLTDIELLRLVLLLLGRLTVVELLRLVLLLLGRLTVVELLRLEEFEEFTSLPVTGLAGKVVDVLLVELLLSLCTLVVFLLELVLILEFLPALIDEVPTFLLLELLPEERFTTGASPSFIETERGILLRFLLLFGLVLKEPGCLLPFSLPVFGVELLEPLLIE